MAILETQGRHPSIVAVSRRFEIDHLTDPDLRQVGMASARLAAEMLARIRGEDVELTKALDKLADARDGFMRALKYTQGG
jgi:hypothetical protein